MGLFRDTTPIAHSQLQRFDVNQSWPKTKAPAVRATGRVSTCESLPASERFLALIAEHYPVWREARAELNELPLAAEVWNE